MSVPGVVMLSLDRLDEHAHLLEFVAHDEGTGRQVANLLINRRYWEQLGRPDRLVAALEAAS